MAQPRRLALGGPGLNLYVLTDSALIGLLRDGRRFGSVKPPAQLDAIAFNDALNQVAAVSIATGKIYLFDGDQLNLIGTAALPGGTLAKGSRPTLQYSPATKMFYVFCDGSVRVTRMMFTGKGNLVSNVVLLPAVRDAAGLFVDERGTIFRTEGGKLSAYDGDGRAVQCRFTSLRGGDSIQIMRPFSNFQPALMNGPSYFSVLPGEPAGNR